jgi:hypothetical protein
MPDPLDQLLRHGLTEELSDLYEACGKLAARRTSRVDPLSAAVCDCYQACQDALKAESKAVRRYKGGSGVPAKLCGKAGMR